MAYRLQQYVVYGELRNLDYYSTRGFLVLRGQEEGKETVIRLDLTGDCDPDLRGKCFRFTPDEDAHASKVFLREEHQGLQDRQIGPTGTMTAKGWVRAFKCPVEEFVRRAELGEPPPTEWKRHLYLEWYSRNGRVVVQMAGPVVEECVRTPENEDDEGDWSTIPNTAPIPGTGDMKDDVGPEVTLISRDEDGVHVERWEPRPSDDESGSSPVDLERLLDREAAEVDRAIGIEDEDDEAWRDCELIDYCIEHSDGKPVLSLIKNFDKLPPAESLDDRQIEARLKAVLGQLAMIGVTFDVCTHFTPRDCYRLLRDEILPDESVYEELIGTGWVTHFSTWEYCPRCDEEIEEEFRQREESRSEELDGED